MSTTKNIEPTREQFLAYRRVQSEGRYNMVLDAAEAAKDAGLDLSTYFVIINRYNELYDKYIRVGWIAR